MPQFRVFDMSHSGNRLALRGGDGVFHVVRTTNGAQTAVNDFVHSAVAELGNGTLREERTGRSISVNFDVVGCNLRQAIHCLQE
jgi:hypothetical protein